MFEFRTGVLELTWRRGSSKWIFRFKSRTDGKKWYQNQLKIFNDYISQQWQWEVAKLAPSQGCQDDGWKHLSVKLLLARCFSAKKRYLRILWQKHKVEIINCYFQFTCHSKKTSWHRSEFRLSEFCFCQGMSMADKNIFRDGAELTEKNSRLCQWWLADLTTAPESGMNVQRW